MKKLLQVFALFIFGFSAKSQDALLIANIDSIVSQIDKVEKLDAKFRMAFNYYEAPTSITNSSKIIRKYSHGTWDFVQTFYLKDSLLILVKETGSSYFLKSTKNCTYYYKDRSLIKYTDPSIDDNDKVEIQRKQIQDFEDAKRQWYQYLTKHGA